MTSDEEALSPGEIRSRLDQLRRADPRLEVFGASSHRYRLEPPIAASDLRAWERQHEIELPSDYRRFLLEIGNGGAGPHYGLFPLGTWDGSGRGLEPFNALVGELRAPFRHREAWNLPAERLTPPDEFDSDAHEDAWHDAFEADYYARALLDGSFWISTHGCALRTLLVVSGPERGTIWHDLRADQRGLVPCGVTFRAWYLRWLDDSLASRAPR